MRLRKSKLIAIKNSDIMQCYFRHSKYLYFRLRSHAAVNILYHKRTAVSGLTI